VTSEANKPSRKEDGPRIHRLSIGRRLTICFVLIILVMSVGTGLLLWQSRLVRLQANRLNGVDEELIAVLRFQASLWRFDKRLNDLAQSTDPSRVLEESEKLRVELIENARQTRAAFDRPPPETELDPTLLATLEAVQSSLPAHLEGIRMLATSGDWTALRARVDNQFQPLEFLSSEMVQGIDREVAAERAQAAANIARAERRMFLIVSGTGAVTLLIAAVLGVILTRSITTPLERLMEGSRALARGEFQHRIPVTGSDELAELGVVFNDTRMKLQDLYTDLSAREEKLQESEKNLRNEVHQRKSREIALQRSEEHLAEAQKLSHTGSWVWSIQDRRPVYWSAEMFRIHGFDTAQSPPSIDEINALHPASYWDRFMETIQRSLIEKTDFDYGSELLFPDGTRKYIRMVGHPVLNPVGDVVELMGTTLDFTAQHQAEEALRRTQERLSKARQIATAGELSASIAHEINQPLAAVVANGHACQAWLSGDPPNMERARLSVERIIRDGNSAAEVVRRIRALFKQAAPTKLPVDINQVITEVLRLMEDGIRKKDVIVDTDLNPGLPLASGDRVQLQQLVSNLILNGVEAMDAVTDRPKVLSVRSRQQQDASILIEVRDRGVGVRDPEKIFEALFTTKEHGMGMGLAICRSIVDAHGGRLWAASNENAGAVFSFTLPPQATPV
jgi:nitrogen fixation/metabolism regulation signal transduction histidine kinase